MAAPASALSAARGFLADRLQERCDLIGVQFSYGPPDAYEANEVVALMGVHEPDEEWAALGAERKAETFVLQVGVKVYDPAESSARTVDVRALELVDEVRDVVHTNLTLGSAVMFCQARQTRSEGALPAADGGWGIMLFVDVACTARISTKG